MFSVTFIIHLKSLRGKNSNHQRKSDFLQQRNGNNKNAQKYSCHIQASSFQEKNYYGNKMLNELKHYLSKNRGETYIP